MSAAVLSGTSNRPTVTALIPMGAMAARVEQSLPVGNENAN
jgi:hypothetical protein